MIGHLDGRLTEKLPPLVVVDCGGVGYEVHVPMSTFYTLGAVGSAVRLLTHHVVREDAQLLFGFATAAERQAFRTLIKISGVGPKVALAVLSGMRVDELAEAVAEQSAARLIKIPGVGKKTAERLLLELKGKLAEAMPIFAAAAATGMAVSAQTMPPAGRSPQQHDIWQALLELGYNEREAAAALKALPADIEVGEGIRRALQALV